MKNNLKKICSSLIIMSLSLSLAFVPGMFSKKSFADSQASQYIGEIEVAPGNEMTFPYVCSATGDTGTFEVTASQDSSEFFMRMYDESKYLLKEKFATGTGSMTFSPTAIGPRYFGVMNNGSAIETFDGDLSVKGSSYIGLQCATSGANVLKVLSALLSIIVGGNILLNY